MNLKLMGIVAVVIAVIAVVCFATYYAIEDKWFTPWDDDPVDPADVGGMWSEEIFLVYADGSTDSLKAVIDNPWPLSVFYEQNPIVEIRYQIYASAIGQDFTVCNLDLSSFTIDTTVGGVGYHDTNNIGWDWPDQTCYLPLDGEEVFIGRTAVDIDSVLSEATSGGYRVTFEITGSIRYRGENGYNGDWQNADLPSGLEIVVDNIAGWVYLDVSGGYTWT